MSVVTDKLELLITAIDKGATSTIRGVGDSADQQTGKFSNLKQVGTSALQRLGLEGQSSGQIISKGLALGAVGGAAALGGLAVEGIQKFVDMTAEVRTYQRYLGGTAEDASKVAAAVRAVGLDAGAAQSGFGQLAKRIGEGKDTLSEWNVQVDRNKDGTVNMAQTLLNVGDRYREIADPAQRAAFLTENFGKSGQNLAPLFSKSREELQKFYDEAAKHHEIFSQQQLDQGREYALKIRELKAAFEGLAIEVGGAVLPIVSTLTDVLKFAIETLDSVGQAIGGVNLASIGAGAAIGAMVAGPWGALAGAGIGIISALSGMEDHFGALGQGVDGLGKKLDTLSQKQALLEWHKAIDQLGSLGGSLDSAGAHLKLFHDLADKDPAAAAKVVQGMKDAGEATGPYVDVLDKVVQKHKEQKDNQDKAKAAQDALNGSTREGKNALDAYTTALHDQSAAMDEVQNKLLGAPGALLNQEQAQRSLTQAQNAYNQAVADYGPDSDQAAAAALNLDGAHQALAQSTLDLDAKQAALIETVKKNPAAVDAEIQKLREAQQAHPEAAASIQPLIDQLLTLKQKYDDIPPEKHTDVSVSLVNDWVLTDLRQQLGYLTDQQWVVAVTVQGDTSLAAVTGSSRTIKHNIVPITW